MRFCPTITRLIWNSAGSSGEPTSESSAGLGVDADCPRGAAGNGAAGNGAAGSNEGSVFDYLKAEDGFGVPQLFIYSISDDVISAADVAEAADSREKAGCDVTKVAYDESPHVQHLRTHRESYMSSVVSFVGKCLKEGGARAASNGAKVTKAKDVLDGNEI